MSDITIVDIPFAGGGGLTPEMSQRLHPEFLKFYDQAYSASRPWSTRLTPQMLRMRVHTPHATSQRRA
jgi:hypothetical protein